MYKGLRMPVLDGMPTHITQSRQPSNHNHRFMDLARHASAANSSRGAAAGMAGIAKLLGGLQGDWTGFIGIAWRTERP
jgi:hypothetical protein